VDLTSGRNAISALSKNSRLTKYLKQKVLFLFLLRNFKILLPINCSYWESVNSLMFRYGTLLCGWCPSFIFGGPRDGRLWLRTCVVFLLVPRNTFWKMFALNRPLSQFTFFAQGNHLVISHTISQYSKMRHWQERFFVENFDNCWNITSVSFTQKFAGQFSPFEIVIVSSYILVSTYDKIRYRCWPRACRAVGFP